MASFKTDESFLEKISLGAIGTQEVFKKLVALGHKPIELERGSMNYKIWKKINFQKKTQKTPKQEIDKALKIKKEYESEKK